MEDIIEELIGVDNWLEKDYGKEFRVIENFDLGNWVDGLIEKGILEKYVERIGWGRMSLFLVKILRWL